MLNNVFILECIKPYLNSKKELSEIEFFKLFGNLTKKEQYEIINLMIANDIEYVEEKEEDKQELDNINFINHDYSNVDYKKLINISNEQLCIMAQQGDVVAASTIVFKNKRFVYKIALDINKQFHQNTLTIEDMIQEGCIGILDAVYKFDAKKDNKFITYSWHWIRQRITRAIIDTGYIIRLPVYKHDQISKLNVIRNNNPDCTISELSNLLDNITGPEVLELINLSEIYLNVTSLNLLVGEDKSTELCDLLPDNSSALVEDVIVNNTLQEAIVESLLLLSPREQQILTLRFGFCDGNAHTLEYVGNSLGVTRERIRQIEAKALKKLKRMKKTNDLKDFITN